MLDKFMTMVKFCIGVGWVLLTLPVICGDEALQAVVRTVNDEFSRLHAVVDPEGQYGSIWTHHSVLSGKA